MDSIEGIIYILALFLVVIGSIAEIIKKKMQKKQINFDEFDDIDKIKQQTLTEKHDLEHESNLINNVYNASYANSIAETIINMNSTGATEITEADRREAHLDAINEVQKVDAALYKNKNHNIREEIITEGSEAVELKENGYNFDVELFKKWAMQIFVCIKLGTKEQLNIVKNFISHELYAKLNKQTAMFARDGLEFVTEDLNILKCTLLDYGRSMSKEEIKILIVASLREYILHKSTNEVIRGDSRKFYTKQIIMTFQKNNITEDEGFIHNCPNCGAEVTQTEFGKCRYCGTLVLPIRYNWTLTKFETM